MERHFKALLVDRSQKQFSSPARASGHEVVEGNAHAYETRCRNCRR